MKCQDCNTPTEVIDRRIGFFGLVEVKCAYCRDCLPAHAGEFGQTPAETLAMYDELVSAVERSRAAHQAKKEAQA